MSINVKKSEIILLIMDYLKNEGLYKSLVSLEEETKINLFDFNEQIALLRKLILDGQWDFAEEFLKPLQEHAQFSYKESIYEIKKQKFLEAVESEPEDGKNGDELLNMLTELQNLSSAEVFNQLMNCLSTPSIRDHEEYKNWSPTAFRFECFNKLRKNLEIIYPASWEETKLTNGTFLKAFKKFIINWVTLKSNKKEKVKFSLQLLESYISEKDDSNIQFVIENDLCLQTKIEEDKNLLRQSRNDMISKGMQLNKNPNERDSNDNFNLLLQSKLTYKQNGDDILEEVIEEDIHRGSDDEEIKGENKEEKLSDLDKEEFYMKSCYEFYDYDISSLALKRVIEDTHPIRTSCFSPKGDYFAIGTNSKSVKIYHMKQILSKFNKKNAYNFKSNDENLFNEEENDNNDIKLIFEQKNHHMGSIYCLDWSVSGRLIASGSNDKTVKLMVVPELEESFYLKDQETLELPIVGHKGTIRSVCFEPTSDLVLLSAGTVDTCIKVWDTEKGLNKANLEGHTADIFSIKWSNDSLLCGSSGVDKTIRFWDLRECKSTSLLSAIKYSDINDISIFTRNKSYSSTFVAAGHVDGLITVWDYNKRNIIKEIYEHTDEVRSVAFSPDGRYLASASFDSKLKLFDVENNFELIGELEHNDRVVSLKWHPEVPMLISTSADKTARLWIPDTL